MAVPNRVWISCSWIVINQSTTRLCGNGTSGKIKYTHTFYRYDILVWSNQMDAGNNIKVNIEEEIATKR